nr:hypothetical protein [Tanacetum cinerariifolium]
MGRDAVQLETTVTTISQEYLLEFTSEYRVSEALHPELPGLEERIVDFPEGKTQPEAILCLVGLSRTYYLGDEVYPTFLHDDDRGGLIRAPNPTKVKIGTRSRAAHEVPLMTVTASRVIEIEDPAAATDSSGVPSTIERGKSLAAIKLGMGSTHPVPASQGAPVDNTLFCQLEKYEANECGRVRDSEDLNRCCGVAGYNAGDDDEQMCDLSHIILQQMLPNLPWERPRPEIRNQRIPLLPPWSGHPKAFIGQNGDLVDHIAPPGYFLELRHLHNVDFLKQYNVNLARQVAMGSQLRLRFEQEAKLLKKYVAQVARRDKRIQAGENEIKNLETLLEAETDMKKAAEGRSAELSKELENMRALFLDLQRCAEIDARLDVLSIDFDKELYPHMLTAIAGRMDGKGMSKGLKHGVEHVKANLSLEAIDAYDPEADAKYIAALHALKDLKYPIVDQLESLKDAPDNGLLKPRE